MKSHRFLIADLMHRLGWRFPVLIILSALVGLSEGASIILLLPLLNRVGIVTTAAPGVASDLIDKGIAFLGLSGIAAIFILVIAISTAQMLLSISLHWWEVTLATHYQSQRQLELFTAFMRAKWAFIVDHKVGEMTSAIVTECERLGRAFTLCLSLFGSGILILVYVVLAMLIAWQVTLSLIAFAVLAASLMSRFYKKSYALGKNLSPLNAQFLSALGEQLAAVKFIKASAGVDRAITQIEPVLGRLENMSARAIAMPGMMRALLEYVALIGLATILVVTSIGFKVPPSDIIVALALFGRLFPRLTTVQAQLHALNTHVHSLATINSLQSTAQAAAERPDHSRDCLKIDHPSTLTVRSLQVRLGDRVILDDINLTQGIPGLLALVGKSGAGKSSLVHALLGLVEPSAGSIRLGDYNLASTPLGAWRRAIGYVPQETILFHASIRENVTFVNPTASDTEIELAARRAHAHDFIMALPQGYQTIIGDQGVKLSGGQRQRLGIARALLTNPLLLVLDEAMSSLDAVSELEIIRTLDELKKQIGILVVAHRLAAVSSADWIYVFEKGQIAETGTWDDLMLRRGRLYALATAQGVHRAAATAP